MTKTLNIIGKLNANYVCGAIICAAFLKEFRQSPLNLFLLGENHWA